MLRRTLVWIEFIFVRFFLLVIFEAILLSVSVLCGLAVPFLVLIKMPDVYICLKFEKKYISNGLLMFEQTVTRIPQGSILGPYLLD